ncbi:uncharacterized protein ALTATR162_LOCUS9683 [Alternaria atra]|uniref:Hydrophobin n=1 Tax=Alternaria atra TaxID=119953 RepID=A0A8J2IIK1_9PLEO|nr:uncharacterized protein ALTATR162_LOCUS9683 [Alternaria atra]CAG5181280.1 unnamed protein product [Alternaria atra]
MRYSILAFAAGVAAAPFASTGTGSLCPAGLYSNPQCCATDVLGAVGLNCKVPTTTPANTTDFISGCAATGQQAKCCVIPVAGQDVLCQDVSPGAGAPGGGAPAPTPTATVTATAPGGGAPTPTAGPPGGPGGPPAPPASSSCESSTAPAPTPSDCGCDE